MPRDAITVPIETAEELYENAPCGYISTLPDGLIVRVNRTFLIQSSYGAVGLLNKKRIQDLLSVPSRVFYDTHFSPLLRMQGFIKEISCDMIRPDGDPMPVLMNAVQVMNPSGEPEFIRFTIFEAAERRRFESDLLNASRRAGHYESIVKASADAILSVAPDGAVRTWNPGAEKIFGHSAAEAIGRSMNDLIDLGADRDILTNSRDRLRNGQAVSGVANCLSKHGTRLDLSFTLAPHIEPPNELTGISAILRDITEGRIAEETERQRELLENLVRFQEDERQRIARDLHDHIGAQLTGISLALSDIAGRVSSNDEAREKLDRLQEQVRQMDRDVGFLAFELRPSAIRDLGLVKAIENFADQWARHYDIEVEFRCGVAAADQVFTNETEANLYRIIQESLNNICKHAAATKVDIILEAGDSTISLIIEDNGCGFDSDAIVPATQTAGHGAGLSGMRERALLLGGTLEVETSPDAGTTIFVRVPRLPAGDRPRISEATPHTQ